MKYFKFTQISEETGISWMIKQPLSGPSLPFSLLPGLSNTTQLSYDPAYYIGQADDSAQANPDNFIFEITAQERAEELKKHVEHMRQERLDNIYSDEKEFRQGVFSKYDESASIAGVYKYDEAKALVADNTAAAPQIRQEATVRGVDPVTLAQRIITNHEDFRAKEAKIAGIRGMVQDRLTSYNFDLQSPDQSVEEFLSMEKVGEKTEKRFENGQMVDKTIDVMVGKYSLAIETRYQYLG